VDDIVEQTTAIKSSAFRLSYQESPAPIEWMDEDIAKRDEATESVLQSIATDISRPHP